jgi:hypothetical protein
MVPHSGTRGYKQQCAVDFSVGIYFMEELLGYKQSFVSRLCP